jgi:transposase-like protein
MNATHDSLVKFDRRGRLRYAPEQKVALIEAYAASGLSGPKFAALHGVNYQTFAAWLEHEVHAAEQAVVDFFRGL